VSRRKILVYLENSVFCEDRVQLAGQQYALIKT